MQFLNKTDFRIYNLYLMLTRNNTGITRSALAKELNCSLVTVGSDIEILSKILFEFNDKIVGIYKIGNAFFLDSLFKEFGNQLIRYLLKNSRTYEILSYSLFSKNISAQKYANTHYLSLTTLYREIGFINEVLLNYDAVLDSTTMSISGDETKIRLLSYFLLDTIEESEDSQNNPLAWEIIDELYKKTNFNEIVLRKIYYIISITINRVKSRCYINNHTIFFKTVSTPIDFVVESRLRDFFLSINIPPEHIKNETITTCQAIIYLVLNLHETEFTNFIFQQTIDEQPKFIIEAISLIDEYTKIDINSNVEPIIYLTLLSFITLGSFIVLENAILNSNELNVKSDAYFKLEVHAWDYYQVLTKKFQLEMNNNTFSIFLKNKYFLKEIFITILFAINYPNIAVKFKYKVLLLFNGGFFYNLYLSKYIQYFDNGLILTSEIKSADIILTNSTQIQKKYTKALYITKIPYSIDEYYMLLKSIYNKLISFE